MAEGLQLSGGNFTIPVSNAGIERAGPLEQLGDFARAGLDGLRGYVDRARGAFSGARVQPEVVEADLSTPNSAELEVDLGTHTLTEVEADLGAVTLQAKSKRDLELEIDVLELKLGQGGLTQGEHTRLGDLRKELTGYDRAVGDFSRQGDTGFKQRGKGGPTGHSRAGRGNKRG